MEKETAPHPHVVRRAASQTIFLLKKIPLYEAIIAVLVSLIVSFGFWIISSSRAQTNILQPHYVLSAKESCNAVAFEWKPQAQKAVLLSASKKPDPAKESVLNQDVSGASSYNWMIPTPGVTYYAALYSKYYYFGNLLNYTRRVSNIVTIRVPFDCQVGMPDLVVANIMLASSISSSNTQMSAGVTISNQGQASTGSSFIVSLYPDQTQIPPNTCWNPPLGILEGTPTLPNPVVSVTRPPLSAGARDSFVMSFIPIAQPPGTYTGWVVADSTCQIKEQTETNNARSFQYSVGRDTIPPTASIIKPLNGQTVSGKVEIFAKAQDNVAVKQVLFAVATLNNGTRWLPVDTTTDSLGYYSTYWDTTAIGQDTAAIYAAAQDTSGNYSTWARAWPIYVKNGIPTPTPTPSGMMSVSFGCSGSTMGVSATLSWTPRPSYSGTYLVFARPSGITDKNWRLLGSTNQTQLGPLYGFSTNTNYDFMVATPSNPEGVWAQVENQLTPSCLD